MDRLGLGLLIGRLFVGYWFLSSAVRKIVTRNYLFSDALLGPLDAFVSGPGPDWYKSFLTDIVIPHVRVFSWLVVAGELGAGIGLLLGLWTATSCLVGLFLVVNFLCAKGFENPAAAIDKAFIVLLLILYLGRAGRVLGADGWRARGA